MLKTTQQIPKADPRRWLLGEVGTGLDLMSPIPRDGIKQSGAVTHEQEGGRDENTQVLTDLQTTWRRKKPDIHVPYLYVDMGAAVLCASFMSFGVKRRWFALAAAIQLAISTYASYVGEQVYYGDWLKVRMYSRALAIIGGFLVLASGAGEVYRQKPRSRSLQSTGQVFLGVYLICMVYSLQHSKEDQQAYLNHILGGEITLMLLEVLFGVLALAFLSGCYIRLAAQILATVLPLVILLIDGNLGYWHHSRKVEFWNQMKLIGHNVGIFGAVLILATDG